MARVAEKNLDDVVTEALVLMEGTLANPKPLSGELSRMWVLVLQQAGVPASEVLPTVARLLQTQTFFPTPADFLKAWRPAEDQDAKDELAWQRVLTCLRRYGSRASLHLSDFDGDGGIVWALDRIGWERLGRELTEENRAIWRAEFVRLYRAGRTTNATLDYLPGWFERENRANGRDMNGIAAGRPDWKELPCLAGPKALPAPNGKRDLESLAGIEFPQPDSGFGSNKGENDGR